jgi:hypothetical protein
VNIPVTITNAGSCALEVKTPFGPRLGGTAVGMAAKKIYNINGRFIGTVNCVADVRTMALPKGIYIISGRYGAPQKVVAGIPQ